MKRFLILLLLPIFLAGCSTPPPVGTEPSSEPTLPEPSGLYAPESDLEHSTGGAVKCYPLDDNTYSRMFPLGNNLLLLSRDNTRLTLVTGTNLAPTVEKELPFHLHHIQTCSEGVAYLDEQNRSLVFLSDTLHETSRLHLPERSIGTPWLSPDWRSLYYCTETGLQRLDLDSGISQLITKQASTSQSVSGVFLNGSVVRCQITTPEGIELTRMISTVNGEILWEGTAMKELSSAGDNWFATVDRGSVQEMLFGDDGQIRNLWLQDAYDGILSLPEQNAVLAYSEATWGIRIHYYDLTSGYRIASERLRGIQNLQTICPVASGEGIWLLAQNAQQGTDVILRWLPANSPTEDSADYTSHHYTRAEPDLPGLQALNAQLQSLQRTYRISLSIGENAATVPKGMTVETEYLIPAYERYLPILENLISRFPEGFFVKAAQKTPSGLIHIALVRDFQGQVPNMPTLAFRQDGDIYVVLKLDKNLEQNFYHGVSHLIETRLLSNSAALYDWDSLNPKDFSYDNDYKKNLLRDGTQYLQGTNRAFVDTFSMSFEREDRARILEYACMPGNEKLFQSKFLQQKLRMLCIAIQEAFSLERGNYVWQQYLTDTPLP